MRIICDNEGGGRHGDTPDYEVSSAGRPQRVTVVVLWMSFIFAPVVFVLAALALDWIDPGPLLWVATVCVTLLSAIGALRLPPIGWTRVDREQGRG